MTPTLLNSTLWARRPVASLCAILAVAGAIAFVAPGLIRPKPVASAVLSDPWQCSQTAGILTVCTKKHG